MRIFIILLLVFLGGCASTKDALRNTATITKIEGGYKLQSNRKGKVIFDGTIEGEKIKMTSDTKTASALKNIAEIMATRALEKQQE